MSRVKSHGDIYVCHSIDSLQHSLEDVDFRIAAMQFVVLILIPGVVAGYLSDTAAVFRECRRFTMMNNRIEVGVADLPQRAFGNPGF